MIISALRRVRGVFMFIVFMVRSPYFTEILITYSVLVTESLAVTLAK